MIRVVVDEDRCEGHGMCQDAGPDVFELDDDGLVVLRHDPVPDALAAQARGGVRVCPVAALSLQEG